MVLPNFFLCGAPKAGTTSVYHYLDEHPNVFMSDPKETWFFKSGNVGNLEHYSRTYFEGYDGERAVGEGTTAYMGHPEVPARIAQHIPDAKLIFLLRNPVERVYSQYWFRLQRGKFRPTTSFSEAIREQNDNALGVGLIELGRYYRHLTHYEQHFDRSQMLVLLFRDLRENSKALMHDLYSFIGVDPSFTPGEMDKYNSTRYPKSMPAYRAIDAVWQPIRKAIPDALIRATKPLRSAGKQLLYQQEAQEKPEMSFEDRQYLRALYREPNEKLADWLDRDLSHWQ